MVDNPDSKPGPSGPAIESSSGAAPLLISEVALHVRQTAPVAAPAEAEAAAAAVAVPAAPTATSGTATASVAAAGTMEATRHSDGPYFVHNSLATICSCYGGRSAVGPCAAPTRRPKNIIHCEKKGPSQPVRRGLIFELSGI